jgi:ElaA protein
MQLSLSWHWISGKKLQPEQLYSILSLRQEVFVVEQNCPYLDTDGHDFECHHMLGLSKDNELVAYARVFSPSLNQEELGRIYIGRVIVKKSHRGLKIGDILMEQSEKYALQEYESINNVEIYFALHAQAHLQNFYGRMGYTSKGDLFDEDGIPHILMLK